MFSDMKKYVYSESVPNTLYTELRCKSNTISSRQNKRYKNALFFLSRATTHHSLSFNLRFLYELKHKVRVTKSMGGVFHFRFLFVFIKVDVFEQQNVWTL